VPRKKKQTTNALPNTSDTCLLANTGMKKNEIKDKQKNQCAAALERKSFFINRCNASMKQM